LIPATSAFPPEAKAMQNLKVIDTGDGSHTLLNLEMDETYHSRHGALRESKHVFIRQGLDYLLSSQPDLQSIRIFEMGLGTGLNLILTIAHALRNPDKTYHYTTLEAFPLKQEIISELNYGELLESEQLKNIFQQVHTLAWEQEQEVLPNFSLTKRIQTLENYTMPDNNCDLVYYDAFAPNKQPELWSFEILKKVCGFLSAGGVFVTYSAKGQLKRDLRSLGLLVETLPGPPGKAEMVRASNPQ
jgi:tRNA U34 5-methylaminomethyl-2-thiouridine-forming methyltransferase MnmC